jgi:hypothetical protein
MSPRRYFPKIPTRIFSALRSGKKLLEDNKFAESSRRIFSSSISVEKNKTVLRKYLMQTDFHQKKLKEGLYSN